MPPQLSTSHIKTHFNIIIKQICKLVHFHPSTVLPDYQYEQQPWFLYSLRDPHWIIIFNGYKNSEEK